ncbi:hypothetical protein DRW48_15445 [Paracoccus suum]|uniref:Alkaline proteinase inhibitor/ Outer membrane lipoprotein Omp19 domain-containing protein n=2 Tax=Paracoccus suum TaxID=2259340 RepID=A0A344PND3_9RHOB|nr:hypothetical protein DRW48_15445 [Paracoccus suum]
MALLALAAMTMVLGDALAASPRTSFGFRLDLLTPAGMSCAADAPGASVRQGRDLLGRPLLNVTGDLTGAAITCTTPQGARFTTPLPVDTRDRLAAQVDAVGVWRAGSDRMGLLINPDGDRFATPETHRFTRLP